ncbi:MAG: GTPase ObgE [Actinomycetota bacterium]
MSFVDEARIIVMAGDGGNGAVSFHSEPFKPKGGPDGGDGADGGSVILRADLSVGTLLDVRDHPHIKADKGGQGQGKKRSGARGKERVVLVPPGTIVYDPVGVMQADLAAPGDEFVAARGGKGGKGNAQFATATRRAPTFSEPGEPGEQRELRLELRLLADVGLVGFPNAGKSTFISRISAAKPKIADYPFTTLVPNLGVVKHGESSFVVADIPGLLPGAHEGKGLGHRFLRHIRRAAVILFMVDLTAQDRDPSEDVEVLRRELAAFDPDLASRPYLIAATKIDVTQEGLDELAARYGDVKPISAVTGAGIPEIVRELAALVTVVRQTQPAPSGYVRHVVPEEPIEIRREDDAWRVTGRRAERSVGTTDMYDEEAVERLQRRLITLGVERKLTAAGAKRGDEVRIGDAAFDFEPEGEPPLTDDSERSSEDA